MSIMTAGTLLFALAAVLFVLLTLLQELRSPVSERDIGPHAAASGNLRKLADAQRARSKAFHGRLAHQRSGLPRSVGTAPAALPSSSNLAYAAAAESDLSRHRAETHARLTLEKRLRYAKWRMTPVQYRALQVGCTLVAFLIASCFFTRWVQVLCIILVPNLLNSVLRMSLERRRAAFDRDYPTMLLQFTSLLKTGINALSGLESVALGLPSGSLVRSEIELLIERLRLGLNEEEAISAFGEDIAHPEIELFIQCLLLNRRVGGTLSSSLERLARQVRKRQQFRLQAEAAVGMERMSGYVIAAVLSLLMGYLLWISPELVKPAFSDPRGVALFEASACLAIFGFYWSRRVSDIKM